MRYPVERQSEPDETAVTGCTPAASTDGRRREVRPFSAGGKILVVGIGSPHGDDRVGWEVAGLLAARPTESSHALSESHSSVMPDVIVRKAAVPQELSDWLTDDVEVLHVIDACRRETETGIVRRFCWPDIPADSDSPSGTHGIGVIEVLRLAAALRVLPPQVFIWAVCGMNFEPNSGMSDAVIARLPQICRAIQAELPHA